MDAASVNRLAAQARGKQVAVLGDPMLDVWIPAEAGHCDEGPLVRQTGDDVHAPGGAAGAARQLEHWNCDVRLLAPLDPTLLALWRPTRTLANAIQNPVKTRYVAADGRVFYRADREADRHGLTHDAMCGVRDDALRALRRGDWDAVLLSDYAKGFFDDILVHAAAALCRERSVPCVADPKRPPACCRQAVLKCTSRYALAHGVGTAYPHPAVVTHGALPPTLCGEDEGGAGVDPGESVACVNAVGAGDCFAAHLALALGCGWALPDAAALAHAAGRAYVQHPHGRPPWPHEVARALDPVAGKIVTDAAALARSLTGRHVVFTNGVFRVPHAGHAWLLAWARRQGDVLVVGVNDDASAARQRPGQAVLPWAERAPALAALGAVDWVVPFAEDTPEVLAAALRPAVLVKGAEYAGTVPPGARHAGCVRCAPASPLPRHATDLVAALSALG